MFHFVVVVSFGVYQLDKDKRIKELEEEVKKLKNVINRVEEAMGVEIAY